MSHKFILILILFAGIGCINKEVNVTSETAEPALGGIAVGITPKLIYADQGKNVSFTIDLLSSENKDDVVTILIQGGWVNTTLRQSIAAGEELSIPITLDVPLKADNTSFRVTVISHNLNSTSSTTGYIVIRHAYNDN